MATTSVVRINYAHEINVLHYADKWKEHLQSLKRRPRVASITRLYSWIRHKLSVLLVTSLTMPLNLAWTLPLKSLMSTSRPSLTLLLHKVRSNCYREFARTLRLLYNRRAMKFASDVSLAILCFPLIRLLTSFADIIYMRSTRPIRGPSRSSKAGEIQGGYKMGGLEANFFELPLFDPRL